MLCYLLATLCSTVGIYFAYPLCGFVSTLPLGFLFFYLSFKLFRNLTVHLVTLGAIAYFYGLMTDFYNAFFFAGFAVLVGLLSAFAVKTVNKLPKDKTRPRIVRFLIFFAVGTVLTFIFSGTPTGYLSAKKDTAGYLSKNYPDQKFEEVRVYYNLQKTCYAAEVSYLYKGNDLTSTIFFRQEVDDGFLKDYSLWLQEKRKSAMIEVLEDLNVKVESQGLSEKTRDGVFHGSYGVVSSEMEPLFHFTVEFREEKPKREDFAEALRTAMTVLKENKFDFGSITFYAVDAGNLVYECTVTPETELEVVLSLVKYVS